MRTIPSVGFAVVFCRRCSQTSDHLSAESPQIALRGGNVSLQCVAQTTTDLPVEVMWKKDSRVSTHRNQVLIPMAKENGS